VFILARRRVPLYALLLVLGVAIALTLVRGDVASVPEGALFGQLLPTMPAGDWRTIIGLAIPLFLVTLVSQNLPGLMVLRSAGYEPRPGLLITSVGGLSLILAPFGAHAVNLAAITAALCTSEEAHPDRAKRWVVAVIYAGFYGLLAIFSPALVRLFLALPHAVIAVITGLALIPALVGSMESMLATKDERDASILTFLATASGLVLFGLGSAFWGLVLGFLALGAKKLLR
jgi:benzoate membrane transport protein